MHVRWFLLALVISGVSASADTLTDFTLSATLQTGTAQGLITINTTNGQVTGGNFTVNVPASPVLPAFRTTFTSLQNTGYNGTNQIADFVSGADTFELSFPLTSLVGYAGSALCSTTARTGCTIANSQGYYPTIYIYFGRELAAAAVTGSLTPVSTPEPSTSQLLVAGLLGVLGFARKRLHAQRENKRPASSRRG